MYAHPRMFVRKYILWLLFYFLETRFSSPNKTLKNERAKNLSTLLEKRLKNPTQNSSLHSPCEFGCPFVLSISTCVLVNIEIYTNVYVIVDMSLTENFFFFSFFLQSTYFSISFRIFSLWLYLFGFFFGFFQFFLSVTPTKFSLINNRSFLLPSD